MKKIILISIAILALCTSGYMLSGTSDESADYQVISQEGAFEIRDYQPMLLVSTAMTETELETGTPFNRLFGYITGANETGQDIAMTAPVLSSRTDGVYRMSFLIPKAVAEKGAPRPTGPDVKIETMPGGRFAAYRFNGYLNNKRLEEARQKLADWVAEQKLETVGETLIAGYDPPSTPGSLRRNEVMIRLAE